MTKANFKVIDDKIIYCFKADEGKTFWTEDNTHIGPIYYASTKGKIEERPIC